MKKIQNQENGKKKKKKKKNGGTYIFYDFCGLPNGK